jgi:pimeloyl-ACP methyl ester carboxylesterase
MAQITLVLLPGLDGSGVLFRPLVSRLPPQLRPIVVTYPQDRLLNYQQLVPLVLAAIPSDGPFLLLGESFGGPLAIMIASALARAGRPGPSGLVLSATFVRNPVWFRPAWLRFLAQPVALRLFPFLSRAKAKLFGYSNSELDALIKEALSQATPQVAAHRLKCVMTVDVRRELADCGLPVLYLRGTRDLVVPRHNAADVAAALPSVRIVPIDAPHLVLQTQPAAGAAAITEFAQAILLNQHSSGAA